MTEHLCHAEGCTTPVPPRLFLCRPLPPDRLQLLAACVTVRGIITSIRQEPDGDDHIRLKVDADQRDPRGRHYVSVGNAAQGGDLVLEPVCEHPPTQPDAVPACAGYRNPLVVPPVGSHVAATGPWVLDLDHGCGPRSTPWRGSRCWREDPPTEAGFGGNPDAGSAAVPAFHAVQAAEQEAATC